MKAQDIFDKVANHFKTQGVPAVGTYKLSADQSNYANVETTTACVYRAEDGKKCAAGVVIPDYVYRKGMEGKSISGVIGEFTVPAYINKNIRLLADLQDAHDESYNRNLRLDSKYAAEKLRAVAVTFSLDSSAVDW